MSIPNFFARIEHLFSKDASTIDALLQPEIDFLKALKVKFSAANFTEANKVALAVVAANTPFAPAVTAVGTSLKASLAAQGITATDDELTRVSQSLITTNAAAVNTAASSPATPPVPVEAPAAQPVEAAAA